MNEKQQNKMIPKLRFPEFKDSGEWEVKPFDLIFDRMPSKKHQINSKEYLIEGKYPVIDQGKQKIIAYSNDDSKVLKNKSIIIFGDHTRVFKYINFNFIVGADGTQLIKTKENYDNKFFYYQLLTKKIPNTGYNRHFKFLKEKLFQIPRIYKEQQKIAAFLSNLDELIEAHKQKLELLKKHKKGLMQNLFPQEGEKVPKLRFPEFKDSGEWEEKQLGEIGEPLMCKRIFKEQTTTNSNNSVPFYKIGTFGKEADSFISIDLYNEYKAKYNFPNKGDILISASGTIGRLVVYDGSPAYFQDSNIVWLENDEKVILNRFLFYCYSILDWQTSDGGVIKRLYNSDLKNIRIIFPKSKPEQQKIASSLSSLDELITAKAEKIEQLEKHKKGLMQGLFPKVS